MHARGLSCCQQLADRVMLHRMEDTHAVSNEQICHCLVSSSQALVLSVACTAQQQQQQQQQ